MSTSLLYHGFAIRGYRYRKTDYVNGEVAFTIEQERETFRCAGCGSDDVESRGTVMRAYRSILMLDVIDRLFRAKPEVQLLRLEEAMAEKEREIEELRHEIDILKVRMATSDSSQNKAA